MKKTTAIAALTAAALCAGAAAPAYAQSAATELSSGSSKGSSKPNYYDPLPQHPAPPEKRPLEGSYTGIAPISLTIATLATALAVQLIVDFVPPVRAAVDDAAAQLGLSWVAGSSEGNRIIPAQQIQQALSQLLQQAL